MKPKRYKINRAVLLKELVDFSDEAIRNGYNTERMQYGELTVRYEGQRRYMIKVQVPDNAVFSVVSATSPQGLAVHVYSSLRSALGHRVTLPGTL